MKGPQRSEWTISNFSVALSFTVENGALCCLAIMHTSQDAESKVDRIEEARESMEVLAWPHRRCPRFLGDKSCGGDVGEGADGGDVVTGSRFCSGLMTRRFLIRWKFSSSFSGASSSSTPLGS